MLLHSQNRRVSTTILVGLPPIDTLCLCGQPTDYPIGEHVDWLVWGRLLGVLDFDDELDGEHSP